MPHASAWRAERKDRARQQRIADERRNGAAFRLAGGVGRELFQPGGGGLYRVIVAAFVASLLLVRRIGRSPFGTTLRAIRDDDTRAEFVGVRVWR